MDLLRMAAVVQVKNDMGQTQAMEMSVAEGSGRTDGILRQIKFHSEESKESRLEALFGG